MKKVIIIPSNTDLNRGDQALVWESIRLVEDIFGKNNVKCVLMGDTKSRDSKLQNQQTDVLGYQMIDTILKHPGRKFSIKRDDSKSYTKQTIIQWGIQALIDYCCSRLMLSTFSSIRFLGKFFLSKEQRMTLAEIESADAVFVKGGGFIHSYGSVTDSYLIYYLTYHIRLAVALGKKVIVLPNSVGPLKNPFAKTIAIDCLRKCSLVTIRENISKKFLDGQGAKSTLYPDLGFFLTPSDCDMENYLKSKGVPFDKKKVVITLRPYRFLGFANPMELYNNYIEAVTGFVGFLIDKGFHVTFMAHTLGPSAHENDSFAIKEVMNQLDKETFSNVSFIEDYDLNCRDVEKIYSYYDYMIGTRFHSVIFSLNVNVPSIAIAYGGNKGKGIMNVLGNDDFSIDMDKICYDTLVDKFEKLVRERDIYLENLKEKRRMIENERIRLIDEIRGILRL